MSNFYGDAERVIVEVQPSNAVPVPKIEEEFDLVCESCCSDDIQEKCWVNVRTQEVIDSCDEGGYYCPECEENVDGIFRKDYDNN